MSAIRSSENKTERLLRSELHKRGLRYRKYRKDLPGKPDIVFVSQRVAIFVDGDYWHARVLVEQGKNELKKSVRSNAKYWIAKFEQTVARDKKATQALQAMHWTVLRFWESDTRRNLDNVASTIQSVLAQRRSKPHNV